MLRPAGRVKRRHAVAVCRGAEQLGGCLVLGLGQLHEATGLSPVSLLYAPDKVRASSFPSGDLLLGDQSLAMEWVGLGWAGLGRAAIASAGWAKLGWGGLGRDCLGWPGPIWAGLGRGCVGRARATLGWALLGCAGLC